MNVRTAIDIFYQSRSENENVLIDKFSSITNVDAGSINKTALISKLYRYKTKLKGKRESAKVEFEKETYSLPVATMQAPVKGKIVDEQIASYAEACSGLASELLDEKQKSMNEIESLKKEYSCHIRMLKSPLNQDRYKILLMIYFIIYRNLLEFITFVQSYFHYLKDLRDFGLDKGGVDPFSPKYRLSSIICDVASFRLFKPVRSEPLHDSNRKFLHIPFTNKGIDAINISNILNRKEVVKEIPPYFKHQSVPIVSYSYTNNIGRKMFNYKKAL